MIYSAKLCTVIYEDTVQDAQDINLSEMDAPLFIKHTPLRVFEPHAA